MSLIHLGEQHTITPMHMEMQLDCGAVVVFVFVFVLVEIWMTEFVKFADPCINQCTSDSVFLRVGYFNCKHQTYQNLPRRIVFIQTYEMVYRFMIWPNDTYVHQAFSGLPIYDLAHRVYQESSGFSGLRFGPRTEDKYTTHSQWFFRFMFWPTATSCIQRFFRF